MKVVTSEFEPQMQAVLAAEVSAPARPLPLRRRVMFTPAVTETRLFHAL